MLLKSVTECGIVISEVRNMNEKYVKPECEFVEYEQMQDILTASENTHNLNNEDNYDYNP